MAGLLNILAIYDAYEGPAYQDEDEEAPRASVVTATSCRRRAEGGGLRMISANPVQVYWLVLAFGRGDQRGLCGFAS